MASSERVNLTIRPMRLDDLEQVREIDRLSFSLPWPESAYHYEISENPAARSWVVEVGAPAAEPKIVGMLVLWLITDEAHIATIAVHPDFRGQGIGRQILAHALMEAMRKGARRAMLEVRASNQTAQALYQRFGFEVVYRRPRYYRDNSEDALLMNLAGMNEKYLEWLEQVAAGQGPADYDRR